MFTKEILLDSVDKVKAFVADMSKLDCDAELITDRSRIDARSIMGVFTLDLAKPVRLSVESHDAGVLAKASDIAAAYAA